jgi:tocopherol cyclase
MPDSERVNRLYAAYRERGADLPFGDPGRDHCAGMEGYYWRIVAPQAVIVVLCGVGRGAAGRWGLVALASHPGTHVRYATAAPVVTPSTGFGVRAGEVLDGSLERLRLRLGDEDWLELRLSVRLAWPRGALGALGAAHVVPGLAQYWHPVLLDGAASGEGCVAGRPLRLDDATVYAEKNWGPGFAGRWWWGQASAFPEEGLGVAFAGGALPRLGATPSAVVLWRDGQVHRFAPPLARSRVALGEGRWRLRTSSPRHCLEIDGQATSPGHVLPVPEPGEPRVEMRSEQVLAGRLALRLSRGGRTLIDSVSPMAGLEQGRPASGEGRPPPAPPRP